MSEKNRGIVNWLFPKAPRARYRRIWIYSILLLCPMMVPPFYDFLVPDLISIAKGTYKEDIWKIPTKQEYLDRLKAARNDDDTDTKPDTPSEK